LLFFIFFKQLVLRILWIRELIWKLIFKFFNSFFINLLYAHIIYSIPRMPTTVQVTIVSAFTCSVIKLFLGIVLLLWSWISVLSIIEKCRVHLLLLPIESFWMLWTCKFHIYVFFCFLQIDKPLLIAFVFF
jgi:hypothetical protein